jgi:hypothetical protein
MGAATGLDVSNGPGEGSGNEEDDLLMGFDSQR